MSGFEPLQPRNLGNFIDVQPHAEKRALEAVQAYIDGLRQNVSMLESLRDSMALVILELLREIRSREKEDFILLERLKQIEYMMNSF